MVTRNEQTPGELVTGAIVLFSVISLDVRTNQLAVRTNQPGVLVPVVC